MRLCFDLLFSSSSSSKATQAKSLNKSCLNIYNQTTVKNKFNSKTHSLLLSSKRRLSAVVSVSCRYVWMHSGFCRVVPYNVNRPLSGIKIAIFRLRNTTANYSSTLNMCLVFMWVIFSVVCCGKGRSFTRVDVITTHCWSLAFRTVSLWKSANEFSKITCYLSWKVINSWIHR